MGHVRVRDGDLDPEWDERHADDPRWWGAQFLRERVESLPSGTPYRLLIGELDGEAVGDGFVVCAPIRAGGFALASVWVRPDARGRGVGGALASEIATAAQDAQLAGFSCSVADDDEHSLAVARHWGCETTGHHKESVLDLTTLDEKRLRGRVARVEAAGVRIECLPPGSDDELWQRAYAALAMTWPDAPDADADSEVMPYAVFRGFVPGPEHVMLAWRDGAPVGITCLCDRAKDQALNTFFTGVTAGARGAGVATALKCAHALAMRDAGHTRIFTQNMDQNAPILAANARLGFRVVDGFYDLARRVPWAAGHTRR